jgi:hypothetical protein
VSERFDPALWCVVRAGNEIAAGTICTADTYGGGFVRTSDLTIESTTAAAKSRCYFGVARRFTNTLSSAARRPTDKAPVSTAASPRLEASIRGGFGSHSASRRRMPS